MPWVQPELHQHRHRSVFLPLNHQVHAHGQVLVVPVQDLVPVKGKEVPGRERGRDLVLNDPSENLLGGFGRPLLGSAPGIGIRRRRRRHRVLSLLSPFVVLMPDSYKFLVAVLERSAQGDGPAESVPVLDQAGKVLADLGPARPVQHCSSAIDVVVVAVVFAVKAAQERQPHRMHQHRSHPVADPVVPVARAADDLVAVRQGGGGAAVAAAGGRGGSIVVVVVVAAAAVRRRAHRLVFVNPATPRLGGLLSSESAAASNAPRPD
jgi:hypothetical protein